MPCSPSRANSFLSYYIDVNPVLSWSYPLFCATARLQTIWNQIFPHTFYRPGVVPLRRPIPIGLAAVLPTKDKNESPNLQPCHYRRILRRQSTRDVHSFHRSRSQVSSSRPPRRSVLSSRRSASPACATR